MNTKPLERTVVAPLQHLGLIAVTGADAETFLQGQFSNDVRQLRLDLAQLSSYNSPKGRMLAVLHLFRDSTAYFVEVHASILEHTLKRLRMYVLRSKVVLDDVSSQRPAIGLAGADARERLAAAGLPVPAAVLECAWSGSACVIRRHDAGAVQRYTVHPLADAAPALLDALQRNAGPVLPDGAAAWRRLDIEAGVPTVYVETQEHFVPQMCNLDALGGISFDKGCYTGQEIVARVHYRGAVKRTMSAVRLPTDPPAPGTKIEPGEVVDAAPHPDGGCLALVVAAT